MKQWLALILTAVLMKDGTAWACGDNSDRQPAMTTGPNSLHFFAQCKVFSTDDTMSVHAYSAAYKGEPLLDCASMAVDLEPGTQSFCLPAGSALGTLEPRWLSCLALSA